MLRSSCEVEAVAQKVWEGICPHCDRRLACHRKSDGVILVATREEAELAFKAALSLVISSPTGFAFSPELLKGFPESISDAFFDLVHLCRAGIIMDGKVAQGAEWPRWRGMFVITLGSARHV